MKDITNGERGVVMTLEPAGGIKIEGKNFTKADGPACKALSDALTVAVGGEVVSEELKPEYAAVGASSQVQVGR
jgi:hypothetical protein